MRIGFAGSPEFAVTILESILSSDFRVVRVLSQPPRRSGRGRVLRPCPVHIRANRARIECFTPPSLHDQVALVNDLDVLVVAAYGLILPEPFFRAPV